MTALLMRGALAACLLGALTALEQVLPRRERRPGRMARWGANLGLQAGDAVVLLALNGALPTLLLAVAFWAESRRIGALHWVRWPFPVKFLLSYLGMDLALYLQHRAFHRFGGLWRFHEVHHTDLDLDASTGLRFHPGEIALSMAFKAAAIGVIGAHFLAVAVFEVALNAAALFTHANITLPAGVERFLRRFLVTPDMHRIHHSIRLEEIDCNFGFQASWWDKLFGTYRVHPKDGHWGMTLGLADHRDESRLGLASLLLLPFRGR